MPEEKLKPYCVGLPPKDIKELQKMSAASGVPRSKMIRQAVHNFIYLYRADYLYNSTRRSVTP